MSSSIFNAYQLSPTYLPPFSTCKDKLRVFIKGRELQGSSQHSRGSNYPPSTPNRRAVSTQEATRMKININPSAEAQDSIPEDITFHLCNHVVRYEELRNYCAFAFIFIKTLVSGLPLRVRGGQQHANRKIRYITFNEEGGKSVIQFFFLSGFLLNVCFFIVVMYYLL